MTNEEEVFFRAVAAALAAYDGKKDATGTARQRRLAKMRAALEAADEVRGTPGPKS